MPNSATVGSEISVAEGRWIPDFVRRLERFQKSGILRSMNQALSLVCLVVIAVLPAGVLGLRAVMPRLMPWWAMLLTLLGVGWPVLVFGAMLQESRSGGAGHVGALFFGWALLLLWFVPWLIVYALIQGIRRRRAARDA